MSVKQYQVTVVVPVYNAEKTIESCYQALETQTLEGIELIFIDDGSTDQSFSILERLKNNQEFVSIYSCRNQGPSHARNLGIQKAKGKYLMFCDSDDVVDRNWCSFLYQEAEKTEKLVVCHLCKEDFAGIKKWDTAEKEFDLRKSYEEKGLDDSYMIYKNQLLNSPCNKIYKRDILKKYSILFDEKLSLGEDLLFNLQYIEKGKCKGYRIVNKVLYHYRENQKETLTTQYRKDYVEIQTQIFESLESFFQKHISKNEMVLKEIYYDYFYLLNKYFDEFMIKNKQNYFKKVNYLNKIVKTNKLLGKAFQNCSFDNDSKIFIQCYKTRNYWLVSLFKLGVKRFYG